jgi:ABC-2 type transport system permease protein
VSRAGGGLGAEWLKLRTVRLPLAVAAAAVCVTLALALRAVVGAGQHGAPSIGTAPAALSVLGATTWGPCFAMVLGVLVVTDEFHHGTITGTLLQRPRRWRLFLSKALTAALAGLALGVLTLTAALSVGVPGGAVPTDVLNVDVVSRSVGLLLLHPAYAVIGAGVGGLLLRAQSVAVLLPLAWVLVLERLIVGVVDRGWLPWTLSGATSAVENAGDVVGVLPVWQGVVLLGAAGLAAGVLGGTHIERTDLT